MRSLFKEKKFKLIFIILFLLIIGLLIFSIETVPNYLKKSEYEFVSYIDYNKYTQGYCLAENRILSNEEILRKGLTQYFQKEIILNQKIQNYRINSYGSSWEVYWHIKYRWKDDGYKLKCNTIKPNIGFYSLENIEKNNFMNEFFKNYNPDKKGIGLLELFFCDFRAKKIIPIEHLNIRDNVAYFSKPIITLGHHEGFTIYLKTFLLKRGIDGYKLIINGVYLPEDYGKINIEQSLESYNKKDYQYEIKLDNCGNIDFNVEEIYEEVKEANGG